MKPTLSEKIIMEHTASSSTDQILEMKFWAAEVIDMFDSYFEKVGLKKKCESGFPNDEFREFDKYNV
jgi:hypothetical protein